MGGNVNLYVILRFRSLDIPLVTLIRRHMKLFKQFDMWLMPKFCTWHRFGVVSFRIGRSEQLCEFCMLLTDLWPCGRSRGAQISKRIEKCDFLAFPRCGNAYLRSESPIPIESYRKETGTYPNRPWRTRWNRNFRNLFVLCRASIENRGICGGATFRTYLRRRRPGRSAL